MDLTPDQVATLNDVYWHSKRTVAEIRRTFDLTQSQLNRLLVPEPAGRRCWLCDAEVRFATRTDRDNASPPYGRLFCACGARQPKLPIDALPPTDAVIVVPLFSRHGDEHWRSWRRRNDASWRPHADIAGDHLCEAVEMLASLGLRWTGSYHAVEADADPASLVERLEALTSRTIVVVAVNVIMNNEGDSLGLFFTLVSRGWRVISTYDARMARDRQTWDGTSSAWDGFADDWQGESADGERFGHLRLLR